MENATRLFTEVQSAYEVLSDPQERAWYDSHESRLSQTGSRKTEEYYHGNIKVTTAEDLEEMCFNRNAFFDFSDKATGFFTTVREIFDRLALEEIMACEMEGLEPAIYPSFGSANDAYEDTVKHFYAAWSNFSTSKSFAWSDMYRHSDAFDRHIRRFMEKENKRYRNEAMKEFNDAVRTLVTFVKHRDPRYTPSYKTDADRHKSMREKAAAQAAKARAANQAKLANDAVASGWTHKDDTGDKEFEETPENEVEEQFECVVCRKTFKSENQFEAHEKSKKHLKAVRQFTREMHRENVALGLDVAGEHTESSENVDQVLAEHSVAVDSTEREEMDPTRQKLSDDIKKGLENESPDRPSEDSSHVDGKAQGASPEPEDLSTDADDEYAPRNEVQERISGLEKEPAYGDVSVDFERLEVEPLLTSAAPEKPKMGKAAEKRAKKAAKNRGDVMTDNTCVTCRARFPSKTKLFNHIKELGHARPVAKTSKNGKR